MWISEILLSDPYFDPNLDFVNFWIWNEASKKKSPTPWGFSRDTPVTETKVAAEKSAETNRMNFELKGSVPVPKIPTPFKSKKWGEEEQYFQWVRYFIW